MGVMSAIEYLSFNPFLVEIDRVSYMAFSAGVAVAVGK